MKEIRIHGRGGQGAAILAEMMVTAFIAEGKIASGFPMFGFERRGAPVSAFVRFDDKPIREKTQIYSPDCLVILHPTQLRMPAVFAGLKPDGIAIVNIKGIPEKNLADNIKLAGLVNGKKIAEEEMGVSIVNTCMLGSFAATTGWISLNSVILSIKEHFKGDLLSLNCSCAKRGFEETIIKKYGD